MVRYPSSMDTTTSRSRDVAYQLHPFTNLGRHESEELLRKFGKALEETADAVTRR